VNLSGWGNYPRIDGRVIDVRGSSAAQAAVQNCDNLIARGNGRAYGDAAINLCATVSMLPSNRILEFDPTTGSVTCEAGILLSDILDIFIPRGWFPPVTPGTKFVTLGGMIASDVHGKNHHKSGSFGDHVDSLDLALADGSVVRCGPNEHPELFNATRGGMGLTGIILSARFRMIPIETPFIRQETLRARNLREAMEHCELSESWTYSVAWIDCLARGDNLGRSLVYLGEHARPDELPPSFDSTLRVIRKTARRMPFDLPGFVLNRWSVAAFNEIYYRQGRVGRSFVDYDSYFYPLDSILEWNRIYGRAGFLQYQCVLPKAASLAGMTALLDRIARSGKGSFLAVLKLFGGQDGLLSFPMEGYTLALDFPADAETFSLLLTLDAIVADHGGRLYLAKDARGTPALLRQGYKRLGEFTATRTRVDPHAKFSSLQSQRLGL
jgi:decaprenylphospho-beta-D-ribofuranose 2-oxidase